MPLWVPEPDQTPDPMWRRPLEFVAFEVAADRSLPSLVLDDFAFVGRFDRRQKPAIWLYAHRRTRCFLNVDEHGRVYRRVVPRDPASRAVGRFVPHERLMTALVAAGLTDAAAWDDEDGPLDAIGPAPAPVSPPARAPRRQRRRHLYLVASAPASA